MKGVLVQASASRFDTFKSVLEGHGVDVNVLNIDDYRWIDQDLGANDILIYFPDFAQSANSPMAVAPVRDFIRHIHAAFPQLEVFPDPELMEYYDDKYPQYLFLHANGYPTPPTIPLVSMEAVRSAEERFGFPMVVKNRYGAGGDYVFKVRSPQELRAMFRMSNFDFMQPAAILRLGKNLLDRRFLYYLIKRRRMEYPFFSAPLIAQRLVQTDRDVRVVVGDGRVVEAHWRIQAGPGQWKVNIDGGGIGEWSAIPEKVTSLCISVARKLGAHWVAFDILKAEGDDYLITEFSPVWHHYAYKEKPTFVYKNDYNIEVPLDLGLDLERLIVESLLKRSMRKREAGVG